MELEERSRELQALFFGGGSDSEPPAQIYEPTAKAAAKSPPAGHAATSHVVEKPTDHASVLLDLLKGDKPASEQAPLPDASQGRGRVAQGAAPSMSELQRKAARDDILSLLAAELGSGQTPPSPPSDEGAEDCASPAQDLLAIFQSQMQSDGAGRRVGDMKLSTAAMQRLQDEQMAAQSRKAALPLQKRDTSTLLSLLNSSSPPAAHPPQPATLLSLLNHRPAPGVVPLHQTQQPPTFPPEFANGQRLQEFQRLMSQEAPQL